jgi:gamma-glutamyltranspeptidase/glutathione hydrolase
MTEPTSTGIGGDMFCLFYDAKTGTVSALNGSGRSGGKCTLETIRKDLDLADDVVGESPMTSVHAATVPGAAAGWADTVERFGSGKLSLEQILAPAIELGEKGFPVSEDAAFFVGPNSEPSTPGRAVTDVASGNTPRQPSAGHRPTLPRCSNPTRRHQTASARPKQATSSSSPT